MSLQAIKDEANKLHTEVREKAYEKHWRKRFSYNHAVDVLDLAQNDAYRATHKFIMGQVNNLTEDNINFTKLEIAVFDEWLIQLANASNYRNFDHLLIIHLIRLNHYKLFSKVMHSIKYTTVQSIIAMKCIEFKNLMCLILMIKGWSNTIKRCAENLFSEAYTEGWDAGVITLLESVDINIAKTLATHGNKNYELISHYPITPKMYLEIFKENQRWPDLNVDNIIFAYKHLSTSLSDEDKYRTAFMLFKYSEIRCHYFEYSSRHDIATKINHCSSIMNAYGKNIFDGCSWEALYSCVRECETDIIYEGNIISYGYSSSLVYSLFCKKYCEYLISNNIKCCRYKIKAMFNYAVRAEWTDIFIKLMGLMTLDAFEQCLQLGFTTKNTTFMKKHSVHIARPIRELCKDKDKFIKFLPALLNICNASVIVKVFVQRRPQAIKTLQKIMQIIANHGGDDAALAIVKCVRAGADISYNDHKIFNKYLYKFNRESVMNLAKINNQYVTNMLLQWAARYGDITCIDNLINLNANINFNHGKAIRTAMYYKQYAVVEYLMMKGAWLRCKDDYLIRHAAIQGNKKLVEKLAFHEEEPCDFRALDNWAIKRLTKNNNDDMISFLNNLTK